MSRLLRDCTLEELEEQKESLIEGSDAVWKATFIYQQRLDEINRCINNLITKNENYERRENSNA
jgi:hypothetical protein